IRLLAPQRSDIGLRRRFFLLRGDNLADEIDPYEPFKWRRRFQRVGISPSDARNVAKHLNRREHESPRDTHEPHTIENAASFRQAFTPQDLQDTCGVWPHRVTTSADHTR